MRVDEQAVFRALANPHRRRLLDLLGDGPRTTGELSERSEGLSRFAVMQHLGVLEEAGLVLVERRGRQRFNHLNAVPIRRVYERWVSRFAGAGARGALALERHLEGRGGEGEAMAGQPRSISIRNEIRLRAPAERVWRAFTSEQHEWFPYSYGGDRLQRIVFEERVGGLVYEDWGEGFGHLYGHVAHYDPPKALCLRSYLSPAIDLEQWAMLEPDGDETVLTQTMTAFGDISDEMAAAIESHGNLKHTEDKLRAWVERGESVRTTV